MSDSLLIEAVRMVMIRDLKSLENEIAAYPDDESLWLTPPGINNSAGNLVLHLAGNLRHFVGGMLGGSGYVRNREAEFSARGMPRSALLAEIAATLSDVTAAFESLDESRLSTSFEIPIAQAPKKVRTSDMLVHLAVHLTYHLGQIDYHRRMLNPGALPVDTISVKVIPEIRS